MGQGGKTLLNIGVTEVTVDVSNEVREVAIINEGANRVFVDYDLPSAITADVGSFGSIPAGQPFTYSAGLMNKLHFITASGATNITIIFR